MIEPALRALKKEYPCHSKPKSEWCDRHGPGGFMGHTCETMARIAKAARLDQALKDVRAAEDRLHDANMRLSALQALEGGGFP